MDINKNVKLEIKWEETFAPTPETPKEVVIPKETYEKLRKHFGSYGFDWYFVDNDVIKYFDSKKNSWNYKKLSEVI